MWGSPIPLRCATGRYVRELHALDEIVQFTGVRHLGIRPHARPALWFARATREVLSGWRAKPVTPPDL